MNDKVFDDEGVLERDLIQPDLELQNQSRESLLEVLHEGASVF